MNTYTVKPYDVLFFRGNKSFDLGEWYSDGVFPPLPSTFQGFVRTALLVKAGLIDTQGKLVDELKANEKVGDDAKMGIELIGPFVYDDNETFVPTPLDLLCDDKTSKVKKSIVPILANDEYLNDLGYKLFSLDLADKPNWARSHMPLINRRSLDKYLRADSPFVCKQPPVEIEDHVGISLDYGDATNRNKRAKDGMFYMTRYRRLKDSASLMFSTSCTENLDGLAGKLGSEGRGAQIQKADTKISFKEDEKFYDELAHSKKLKLLLLQPGVFKTGWLPFPGKIIKDEMILDYNGLKLKLLYARTGQSLRISGFSFRKLKIGDEKSKGIGLKPMLNAVPAGTVYYFEISDSPADAKDILKDLDDSKIRNDPYCQMGFNHVILAKIK